MLLTLTDLDSVQLELFEIFFFPCRGLMYIIVIAMWRHVVVGILHT